MKVKPTLKCQDFPSHILPLIVLNTSCLKELQNNFFNESGCVNAKMKLKIKQRSTNKKKNLKSYVSQDLKERK